MADKKFKLRPLPWEAVEAQHEWLMEQYEQGLNYARQCSRFYEDQLIISNVELEPYRRQTNIRDFRFALGGTSLRDWVAELRDGNVLPSAPTPVFDICDVRTRYMHTVHIYMFEVRRNGRTYTLTMDDAHVARMTEREVHEYLIEEFTRLIRRTENDEVERPPL